MLCLTDNDIVLKLAACDLLNEAVTALDVALTEIQTIESLHYQLRKPNKAWVNRYGQTAIDRAAAFIKSIGTITSVDLDEQKLLSTQPDIDMGEATLFAASHKMSDYIIATGDKRCLQSLAASLTCKPITTRLRGKIICFEQIVLRTIDRHGFELVKSKVILALDCDTALKAAFGSGTEANYANATDALKSYIRDLRKRTGGLLLAAPD